MQTLHTLMMVAVLSGAAAPAAIAQTAATHQKEPEDKSKRPSPPREANVEVHGAKIHVDYGAPSMRGRKVLGTDLVPTNTWWRTGANEATTLVTSKDLMIGSLHVPAGTYTLVTLPSTGTWQLVVCKHTGQWGTERFAADDLGQTAMMSTVLPTPQETMSISFEKTTDVKTQLHVKWDTFDEFVAVHVM